MKYEIPAIKDLHDQLLYVPEKARIRQVENLEKLIHQIEPDRHYPYDFLVYRIIRFRPERSTNAAFPGDMVRRDLMQLLLDLSGSVRIAVCDAGEPVYSIEEVADLYHLSTKTVSRWRANGLVGLKFIFPDAQKRTGFRQSALDRYLRENPECVKRSRAFSRMTESEKTRIIARARDVAEQDGLGLSKTAVRLAKEFGRSREAVRYTLRNHDRRHPDDPVFGGGHKRLSEDEKRNIQRLYEQGTPVKALSRNFRRTPSAIYAIINRMQTKELLAHPVEYVYSPEFDAPDAEEEILGTAPAGAVNRPTRGLSVAELAGAPAYLRHLYETPLLTKERERLLFKRYNYCKYKAAQLIKELDAQKPSGTLLRQIRSLRNQALALKNEIISANLRLVISVAKRHAGPLTSMAQLISDGNFCLMRAVEKFDYSRGNRFSTYASWALMKSFAKTVPEQNYLLSTFKTGNQEMLDLVGSRTPEPFEVLEDPARTIRKRVLGVLSKLSKREQMVISWRFGLGENEEPKTLRQIGATLGVTRERVRQIEARALSKLRGLLEPNTPKPSLA